MESRWTKITSGFFPPVISQFAFPDGDESCSVSEKQEEVHAAPNNGPMSVVIDKVNGQEELREAPEELSDKDVSDSTSTDNTWEDSSEFHRQMVIGDGPSGEEEAVIQSRLATYRDEDVTAESWRAHRKHVFILSEAGKPIYSRYGNEEALSSTMGVMMALVSFIQSGDNSIRSIYSGMETILKGVMLNKYCNLLGGYMCL